MLTTDIQKIFKKYKANDIYELVKALKLLVYTIKLPQEVKGIYFYAARNKLIALNENLSDDKKEEILIELVKLYTENHKCSFHLI